MGLWVVGVFSQSTPDPFGAVAGLDSFWPGTRLQLMGHSCEEYRHEVYRWLLYQFSHEGVLHVGLNAILIIILGIPLEGSLGTVRVFAIFNLGVVGGAMCYMVGDGHSEVIGASGGGYALFAMHFSNLFLNWRQKKFRKPTIALLLLLLAADVILSATAGAGGNVNFSAHVGGFVTG